MNVESKDKPSVLNKPILGTFEGECADANITNKNGLDINRDVWEFVFNSDDYKQGIKLGWYIGFLGHPEDPGCMDFEHACIVMTDGYIDDSGKVHGKFNLIDTPVGRVVKAFIDAGVVFGISVRGAGDIINNSVDAETFVFRGFDLVTFPAFPESIPTFKEIAASTDIETQKKYQRVCAAVKNNLKDITDRETIEVIQSQFAPQSEEYKSLEMRKSEIDNGSDVGNSIDNLDKVRLNCMTSLYIDCQSTIDELNSTIQRLESENLELRSQLDASEIKSSRELSSIRRIMGSQLDDLAKENSSLRSRYKTSVNASSHIKSQLSNEKDSNLIYKQRVEACEAEIKRKDSIISKLRTQLDETVNECRNLKLKSSNRDEKIRKLESDITASKNLLNDFQKAYVDLYACVTGCDPKNISIDNSTSVDSIKHAISCGSQTDESKSIDNNNTVFIEDSSDENLVIL